MAKLLDHTLFDALPYAPMILGLILTFRYLRYIDLTFAASFVLGPAIIARLLLSGESFTTGAITSICAILLLAFFTFSLYHFLSVDPLLSSLLASFAGFATSLLFTQGTLSLASIETPLSPVIAFDFRWLAGRVPLHPGQIAISLAITLVLKHFLDKFLLSEKGLAYRAMEDERSALFLLPSLGISPKYLWLLGSATGNLLCALSGTMVMLKEGQVTSQRGFDALLTTIAAYLLGINLFERRPLPPSSHSRVERTLALLQRMRPTSAALAGLFFYYLLLSAVSRFDVPSSVPKLILVALIVASFTLGKWADLRETINLSRADKTYWAGPNQALEAKNVTVSYPSYPKPIHVLQDIDIEVPASGVSLLIGANGTGKSTLLKYLAGWLKGRGQVTVPVSQLPDDRSTRSEAVAYVSQDATTVTCAALTSIEHLVLFRLGNQSSLWKSWEGARPHENTIPGLPSEAYALPAGFLSGGQRQLLSLHSLLLRPAPPRVILLDEPLTYLDEANAQLFVSILERMVDEGRSIVLVQHDLHPMTSYPSSPARTRVAALVSSLISLHKATSNG